MATTRISVHNINDFEIQENFDLKDGHGFARHIIIRGNDGNNTEITMFSKQKIFKKRGSSE